ncbi:MAG: hypothetical protein HY904_03805 [Deltaproteobacteria bacterium]|nr:hypothetical protein [Deltaproteobacteria bacterium]
MNCPQCGSQEEHVVVEGVPFCRLCGPRVWTAAGPSPTARRLGNSGEPQFETVTAGKKSTQR